MKISVIQLRNLIHEEVSRVVSEARRSAPEGDSPEMDAVLALLPRGMKVAGSRETGWQGSLKVTEKNAREGAAAEKSWAALTDFLSRRPWSRETGERRGWDAATDTGGGSFSGQKGVFVHRSGLRVVLDRAVNFRTGAKTWSLSAKYPQET